MGEKPSAFARRAITSASSGLANAAANDGVHRDVEHRVAREPLELSLQELEALLGDVVGYDVVDADLKMVEAGSVQPGDTIAAEQIAVGNHRGDHPVRPNAADDVIEIGMEERLTAAHRHDPRTQVCEQVDAPKDVTRRNGLRMVVVLVAVRAREVAAPDRNQMRRDGCVWKAERLREHSRLPEPPLESASSTTHPTEIHSHGIDPERACHILIDVATVALVKKGSAGLVPHRTVLRAAGAVRSAGDMPVMKIVTPSLTIERRYSRLWAVLIALVLIMILPVAAAAKEAGKPICVIDMGSNSFRRIVGSFENGRYQQRNTEKMTLGVGDDLARHGRISDPKLADIAKVLSEFKAACEKEGVARVVAIGTAAFREAPNGRQVVDIAASLGIPMEIATEKRESELAYLVGSLGQDGFAVVDNGSRSIELVSQESRVQRYVVFNLGYRIAYETFFAAADYPGQLKSHSAIG